MVGTLATIASLISAGTSAVTGLSSLFGLSGAQKQQNVNAHSEAELNRQFQAQQAELARAWQEEQYDKYNSPSAMVQQYKDAGLNPYALAGGTMPSASTSTTAPSGSMANGLAQADSLVTIMQAFAGLAQLKSNIENTNADTEKKKVETTGQGIENDFKPELYNLQLKQGYVEYENMKLGLHRVQIEIENLTKDLDIKELTVQNLRSEKLLNDARTDEVYANVAVKSLELALMRSQTSKNIAETEKINLENLKLKFEANFREQFGTDPNQPIWNSVIGICGEASNRITDAAESLGNKVKKLIKSSFNL